MTRHLMLGLLSASALALGACGYAGEDEPHESGANRLPEAEPPMAARETTPNSPQAGGTETGTTQGELVDEPGSEDDASSQTGEEEDPAGEESSPYR